MAMLGYGGEQKEKKLVNYAHVAHLNGGHPCFSQARKDWGTTHSKAMSYGPRSAQEQGAGMTFTA